MRLLIGNRSVWVKMTPPEIVGLNLETRFWNEQDRTDCTPGRQA